MPFKRRWHWTNCSVNFMMNSLLKQLSSTIEHCQLEEHNSFHRFYSDIMIWIHWNSETSSIGQSIRDCSMSNLALNRLRQFGNFFVKRIELEEWNTLNELYKIRHCLRLLSVSTSLRHESRSEVKDSHNSRILFLSIKYRQRMPSTLKLVPWT